MTKFFIRLVAFSLVTLMILPPTSGGKRQKVFMISMDGFRYDYLKKANTPNFDALKKSGVSMEYMNNTFITKTFPNHYTMVTGLYTESHGIVANYMYDPVHKAIFTIRSTESFWWDQGEPIWTTAVKAGLKAGVFYWPGSEAEVQGVRPTSYKSYSDDIPFLARVETVIGWLDSGYDLALMYFNEPDKSGHKFGPESDEVSAKVAEMDEVLGNVMRLIEESGLEDEVNLIVTSDHGMTSIDVENRVIDISERVNSSLIARALWGCVAFIMPVPGREADVYEALSGTEHMRVWRKKDIPDHWHMKSNARVPEVFAVADEGWRITDNATKLREKGKKGDHGYDNNLSSMAPIFFAKGPAFKSGEVVKPMTNRDIYPLLCHILGIKMAPNNGSLARSSVLLKESYNPNIAAMSFLNLPLFVFVTFISLIYCVISF